MYLFVEAVSQLYRALLTIQPWVCFLMGSYKDGEKMVGMFLTSMYVIAKIIELLVRLQLFKNATWTLLQSVVSKRLSFLRSSVIKIGHLIQYRKKLRYSIDSNVTIYLHYNICIGKEQFKCIKDP